MLGLARVLGVVRNSFGAQEATLHWLPEAKEWELIARTVRENGAAWTVSCRIQEEENPNREGGCVPPSRPDKFHAVGGPAQQVAYLNHLNTSKQRAIDGLNAQISVDQKEISRLKEELRKANDKCGEMEKEMEDYRRRAEGGMIVNLNVHCRVKLTREGEEKAGPPREIATEELLGQLLADSHIPAGWTYGLAVAYLIERDIQHSHDRDEASILEAARERIKKAKEACQKRGTTGG